MGKRVGTKKIKLTDVMKRLPVAGRELLPPVVTVPEAPNHGTESFDERNLHDEQQVLRTEILMTKGIRARRQLMVLLEIDNAVVMDRYIKRVHARWEMFGSNQDYARHRGEGLSRLDLIESELWSRLGNIDPKAAPGTSVAFLNALLHVQKQRFEVLGLTPKVIAHIGATTAVQGLEFARQVASHDRLAMIAARMLTMIQERTGPRTINHAASDQS